MYTTTKRHYSGTGKNRVAARLKSGRHYSAAGGTVQTNRRYRSSLAAVRNTDRRYQTFCRGGSKCEPPLEMLSHLAAVHVSNCRYKLFCSGGPCFLPLLKKICSDGLFEQCPLLRCSGGRFSNAPLLDFFPRRYSVVLLLCWVKSPVTV